jgi:RNA polymerase sigma-70 factor (ECF subfamily)
MIEEVSHFNQLLSENSSSMEKPDPDDELVKAVLAHDDKAFEVLFERYRRLVVHLISRFFHRRELVEDLTQQAFTKAYFSLKDFRGGQEKSFSVWLSRLTVNICYDELRRRQRRPENLFAELSRDDSQYIENIIEKTSSDSEEDITNRDLAEKLLACLDPQDRLALTLYHSEGYSISEIARIMDWTESNVKARLMRARCFLRNLLEKIV